MTLGDTPKISFSQKCRKSLRIYNYGFCFRKWRSMTLPNGPGFCFQKWRSVRYPDFWLFSTLTFNIVTWWRHTCDVTSCTYTLTDTLSATYDVTVLSPCVTSQVTKIYFWILFPWMTLGENPKMLPIWVNGLSVRLPLFWSIKDSGLVNLLHPSDARVVFSLGYRVDCYSVR